MPTTKRKKSELAKSAVGSISIMQAFKRQKNEAIHPHDTDTSHTTDCPIEVSDYATRESDDIPSDANAMEAPGEQQSTATLELQAESTQAFNNTDNCLNASDTGKSEVVSF